ncbi:TetR/AcrR family transcriptional regulator [Microbacterium sp. NPDC090281]|uniref:TetR/AcrR family transcriptional regulator n=1 Tax=Microbacterium sp. NPDC090281 TaxID=3364208 RepID=UPI0038299AE8
MTVMPRTPGRPAGRTGDALLDTARDVFLEFGYVGTSMDEVARRARISKASLYREHASKSALYAAVVRHWALAGRDAMRPALEDLKANPDLREGLVALGETMRAGILSDPVVAMRRLVIAEAAAHPDVASDYLSQSWDANIRNLAEAMTDLSEVHGLVVDDPRALASEFTWLVVGAPLNAGLLGVMTEAAPVARAVDLFLAGYLRS